MPTVGKKHFGYGKKGKKAAKKYAKKRGLKVKHKSNPGYYAEDRNYKNRLYKALIELNIL
jgi:hypothetical protein